MVIVGPGVLASTRTDVCMHLHRHLEMERFEVLVPCMRGTGGEQEDGSCMTSIES
ncbi:MAG: hypothetical protein H0U88_09330 [Chthoniobacterales bacterium]|nr:hypothetical protein [Chthoniobacterales bacterium]